MDEREYLTTKEAVAYLNNEVGFRTIVRWIHSGSLRAFRRPGKRGHFKILKSDLDNYLREVRPDANESTTAN